MCGGLLKNFGFGLLYWVVFRGCIGVVRVRLVGDLFDKSLLCLDACCFV